MSVSGALTRGQVAAESRMLDTCEIQYPTGATTQDPDTGTVGPVYATRFTTKCRVKVAAGLSARDTEAGGRTVISVIRELHIPVASPDVEPGDIAVVTAVDDSSDPTLLGARLILDGPTPGSQTTARRLQVSEILS